MLAQQAVQDLATLRTRARGRPHHLRRAIELLEPLQERAGDAQLVVVPEVRVPGEHGGEREQERGAQMRRTLARGQPLDAPALIHELEEAADVGAQGRASHALHDRLHVSREALHALVEGRTEVRVEPTSGLEQHDRGDEIAHPRALGPLHPAAQSEVAVGPRQAAEGSDGSVGLPEIAQEHAGRHLGPPGVEDRETRGLPFRGHVEVDRHAEVGVFHAVHGHGPQAGSQALLSVHHEHGIAQRDHATTLGPVVSAHGELGIGEPLAGLERPGHPVDDGFGLLFPLVVSDLNVPERVGIDNATNDVDRSFLIERTLSNHDVLADHGILPVSKPPWFLVALSGMLTASRYGYPSWFPDLKQLCEPA